MEEAKTKTKSERDSLAYATTQHRFYWHRLECMNWGWPGGVIGKSRAPSRPSTASCASSLSVLLLSEILVQMSSNWRRTSLMASEVGGSLSGESPLRVAGGTQLLEEWCEGCCIWWGS